jgi:hypothetical protein
MDLFISIFAGIFMIYGLVLFFGQGKGMMLAGVVCLASGVYAYDTKTFMPLVIGFGVLWLLRILGFENR